MAAGFCAHGIAGAGGIGRQVASWIVDGEPELDLWRMDIRRFGRQYRSRSSTLARTREVYATSYVIHYPNEERLAGRPRGEVEVFGEWVGCEVSPEPLWDPRHAAARLSAASSPA